MRLSKRILSVGLVVVILVCSLCGFSINVTAASTKTLYLNSDLLKAVGVQPAYTYTCACYALAYCRTMLDNKVHYYSEYNRYGTDHYNASCVWGWGDYSTATANSRAGVFKACYDSINNNRPIIIHLNHSKNGQHWVAVVGYQNVTDVNSMSESNLLVIDSIHGFKGAPETLSGYTLNSSLRYVVANSGSVSGSSVEYSLITNGEYYLKNVATGKYLAVDGGKDAQAQNVSVADFTGGNEMKFSVVSESNGYALRPLCSASRMLNIYATNVVSGKNVCIYDNTGHSSQRWRFESVDGGYIIHSSNNLSCVLDVNGSNVQVSSNTGANSQKWVIESINRIEYPGMPVVTVSATNSGEHTTFSWNEAKNADEYELKICDSETGERLFYYTGLTGTSYSVILPEGNYVVYPVSIDNDLRDTECWWTSGAGVNFIVEKGQIQPSLVTSFNGNEYALYEHSMSWIEAQGFCLSIGGHLVTIGSQEEMDFVYNMVGEYKPSLFWLGYNDGDNEGVWMSVEGDEMTYNNWAEWEPDNYNGTENFCALRSDGYWCDLEEFYGNGKIGFICEYEDKEDECRHAYIVIDETPAGCASQGSITYECEKCGDVYSEVLAPTGIHNYYIIEEAEPCCQSYGYTKYECECGDVYTETGTELGDHVASDEWTVLKAPTETSYGIACKLCVACPVQMEYATIDINGNIVSSDDNPSTKPQPPVHDQPLGYDIDAYIADEHTGDVMFNWSAHSGAAYYNIRIFDNDLKEIVNENVEEPYYHWSPITAEKGMLSVASYDANGIKFSESSLVTYNICLVAMGDWWGEYGDVDCSGKVNIKDATLIQKYLSKLADIADVGLGAADVNSDEKINIKDATAIQKYLASISTDTKVGEFYHYAFTDYEITLET